MPSRVLARLGRINKVQPLAITPGSPSALRGVTGALLVLALLDGQRQPKSPSSSRSPKGCGPTPSSRSTENTLPARRAVRFLKSDGTVAATQTSVQTDRGGHFCRVVFPSIAPGAYRLAVQNGAGWSTQTIYVNRAEPRWISEERAYPGLPLKLIGRNLDAWEYGGSAEHAGAPRAGRGRQPRWSSRRTPSIRIASTSPCPPALPPASTTWKSAPIPPSTAATGCGWTTTASFPDTVRDTVVQVERRAHRPDGLGLESGLGQRLQLESRCRCQA